MTQEKKSFIHNNPVFPFENSKIVRSNCTFFRHISLSVPKHFSAAYLFIYSDRAPTLTSLVIQMAKFYSEIEAEITSPCLEHFPPLWTKRSRNRRWKCSPSVIVTFKLFTLHNDESVRYRSIGFGFYVILIHANFQLRGDYLIVNYFERSRENSVPFWINVWKIPILLMCDDFFHFFKYCLYNYQVHMNVKQ